MRREGDGTAEWASRHTTTENATASGGPVRARRHGMQRKCRVGHLVDSVVRYTCARSTEDIGGSSKESGQGGCHPSWPIDPSPFSHDPLPLELSGSGFQAISSQDCSPQVSGLTMV